MNEPITDSRHDTAMAKIQLYLGSLRLGLRGVPKEDVDEIALEIRSHLMEQVGQPADPAAAAAAISALGPASDLAARFRTEIRLGQAESSYSPVTLMAAIVQWATMSTAGFFTALVGLVGYSLGVGLIAAGLLDPFFPDQIGLWSGPGTFALGTTTSVHETTELLGHWITPIGLVGGLLAIVFTTRSLRRLIARFGLARSRPGQD